VRKESQRSELLRADKASKDEEADVSQQTRLLLTEKATRRKREAQESRGLNWGQGDFRLRLVLVNLPRSGRSWRKRGGASHHETLQLAEHESNDTEGASAS
jgi:hypothetical protein